MGNIVVTGASSGIGCAIAHYLHSQGHHIIALSRGQVDTRFQSIACDLADTKSIAQALAKLDKEPEITALVNAAGIGIFEPHEELNAQSIERLVQINLTAPMLLAQAFLRRIKAQKGFILNITSIEATRQAKFSALYSASKAGLRAFGLSLFEEVRKSGVQVITINPDMTDTPFFDALHFKPHADAVLDPQSITAMIDAALKLPERATITELTIRPQYFKIEKKAKDAKK